MEESMRFKLGVLSYIATLTVVLTSCEREETTPLSLPPDAQAGHIKMEADIYVVGDVEYDAERGMLAVPENRDNPDSRLIILPITRVLAKGDNPGEPILFLNGGPGVSNMHFKQIEGLIENHDIVMVGYRGVDGPVTLNCPEVDAFFSDPPGDLIEQSTINAMAEAYAQCAVRLQSEGVDTDGYTITEVVQDMEDARRALGYEKVNLLSQSYGTRLAMIYAWVYPNAIQRSAMISVKPPGHFVWHPDVIDQQLQYYAALGKKNEEYSARTEDLAETMRSAIEKMPERWLFFRIKKGNVLMGTFMMLYHTDTSADVFDAWLAADEGDWSGIALMSLAIDYMVEGASVWGESAAKAMSSDYHFQPGSNPLAQFMPPGSIIGAPGSTLGIAGANGWPVKRIPDSLLYVHPSDVPTLLISGSIDFSTPARFARDELLPMLKNGQQVILSEFGHTGDIWFTQHEATMHLLKTFFDTGIVDDSHFEYAPMDFHVGLGFPGMMKLALASIIVLPLLFIGLLWIIIRRRRRRKAG
jgi:pimeloyl-ACP methyl ester carboxylesterase